MNPADELAEVVAPNRGTRTFFDRLPEDVQGHLLAIREKYQAGEYASGPKPKSKHFIAGWCVTRFDLPVKEQAVEEFLERGRT